jgi:fumarate hydratase subunit beta
MEEDIEKIRVNDTIYLSGTIVTARDAAHKRALDFHKKGKQLPVNLKGLAIFHCGPIVEKKDDKWKVIAAGPTTSARMDPFENEFIKNFKVRLIIGKGGMGKKIVEAMKRNGALYGAFTGGAAILAAKAVKKVRGVKWSDLGMPEALWILEVEDLGPITVAIDSHGNDLFKKIQSRANIKKQEIYKKIGIK